ncbi:hypothetical protein BGP_2846 [Beggiatoa sp. PS]|nr:hypothetical protein BGP_2846 [Beggiatoa sp. PS]
MNTTGNFGFDFGALVFKTCFVVFFQSFQFCLVGFFYFSYLFDANNAAISDKMMTSMSGIPFKDLSLVINA